MMTALAGSFVVAATALGQLPRTQLSSVFPPGGQVGTTVDVSVAGADLEGLERLTFSHAGIQATPKMTAGSEFESPQPVPGQFLVAIGPNVPAGMYEARVAGRFGVSNPRAFSVGRHPEAVDGSNNSLQQATVLSVGSTVNGRVDGSQRDYFTLPLQAQQRVLIDCHAQRIDSRLNGALVVLDPSGKEVARSVNYEGRDPLLDFTAWEDGEYTVLLSDFLYRGGGDYFYRLTVDQGPHLDFVFPPSGEPGSTATYAVYGRGLPNGEPTHVEIDGKPLERIEVQISLPGDDAARRLDVAGLTLPRASLLDAFAYRIPPALPLPVYFARGHVVPEDGDNDQPSNAQTLAAPCEFVGQFYPERDVDWVQFEAKKGDVFYLDFLSHRLGTDVDARLLIQRVTRDEQGNEVVSEVANVDDPGNRNGSIGSDFDTSTDDPSYRLVADQDAMYRILLLDQFGGSRRDPRAIYRLVISRAEPDFRLAAVAQPRVVPNNANVVQTGATPIRRGGTATLKIEIDRRDGFDGEVEIFAEGLPAGVTTRGAWIGAGQPSTTLVIEAAEDAPAEIATFRVLGKSTINDQEVIREARSGAVVWGSGNRTQDPPSFRTTRDLMLAVIAEPAPTLVEAGDAGIIETSLGGKVEIPLRVVRRGDAKVDLNLQPEGLPNELKPKNVAVKSDAGEAKLEVAVTNGNAKPGVYTFYLWSDAKAKLVRDPRGIELAEARQKQLDARSQEMDAAAKAAAERQAAASKLAEQSKAAAGEAEKAVQAATAQVTQAAAAVQAAAEQLAAAQAAAAASQDDAAARDSAAAAETAKSQADAAKVEAEARKAEAEAALTAARDAAAKAEAERISAEEAAKAASARLAQVQELKKAADKQLEDAKKANQPKDVNFTTVSTPIQLRIVPSPIRLESSSAALDVKPGTSVELPVTVERLYGFTEAIDLKLELPSGVSGLSVADAKLAGDQPTGKLEIVAAADATPGEHRATLRATAKFSNINVQTTLPVMLRVEPAQP